MRLRGYANLRFISTSCWSSVLPCCQNTPRSCRTRQLSASRFGGIQQTRRGRDSPTLTHALRHLLLQRPFWLPHQRVSPGGDGCSVLHGKRGTMARAGLFQRPPNDNGMAKRDLSGHAAKSIFYSRRDNLVYVLARKLRLVGPSLGIGWCPAYGGSIRG